MTSCFRRLHRDDSAQTFVLSVVSLIAVILLLGLPINVGWSIQRRIKLQNAADAAAYSAALMEADTLSAVAWLNNMESYIYAQLCDKVIRFNSLGVHALMVKWGEKTGAGQPPDSEGNKYVENHDKFMTFLDEEIDYIKNSSGERTLELWIKMLRQIKEEMLAALPQMMRHEAMRMAVLNVGNGRVRMAFFPEDNSSPVALNFKPETGSGGSKSFVKFAEWNMESNPFVDRSLQYAKQLRDNEVFGYMNGTTPNLPALKASGEDQWFNVYTGEPLTGSDGNYTSYGKTATCWHPRDTGDTINHPGAPVGHWHLQHVHTHFNCFHIQTKYIHMHIIIPGSHNLGHQQSHRELCGACQRCGGEREVIAIGNITIMENDNRIDEVENLTQETLAGKHHAIRYCTTCNTNNQGEFFESSAKHGLYYADTLNGKKSIKTEHDFGVQGKSQVRVFLEDLLTKKYADWLSSGRDISKSGEYHLIKRETFMPSDGLTPTIWLKEDGEHFFRWGITVALVYPQEGPAFGKTAVYQTRPYMTAVASAKAGMVGNEDDANVPLPPRLITGIGEKGGHTSGEMVDKVLRFKGPDEKMMNLMYTNWGARLIPVDQSSPQPTSESMNPLSLVFNTQTLYKWDDSSSGGKCVAAGGSISGMMSGDGVEWRRLLEAVVY